MMVLGEGEEQAGGELGDSCRWCQPSFLPHYTRVCTLPHITHQKVNLFLPPSVSSMFQVVEVGVIGMGSDKKPGWGSCPLGRHFPRIFPLVVTQTCSLHADARGMG